jgi:hypothetical protein
MLDSEINTKTQIRVIRYISKEFIHETERYKFEDSFLSELKYKAYLGQCMACGSIGHS